MTRPGDDTPQLRALGLSLENVRGFTSLDLTFGVGTTVLIGLNGTGKTTILESIASLLSWLTTRVHHRHSSGPRFEDHDINIHADHCSATLDVMYGEDRYRWTETHTRPGRAPASSPRRGRLDALVAGIQTALSENPNASLPLAVLFPVNRSVPPLQDEATKTAFDQLAAYEDGALTSGNRDFEPFFRWFRQREDLENEDRIDDHTFRDPQLEAVRSAIQSLLPGFSNLRIKRNPQRMLLHKGNEELNVDQLSDGEKGLLAMAGDIARRLAIANPGLADPLTGSGVVLIDEIELHLHPQWQREIIPRLEKTFPGCQFIVTTHSPQVLSRVQPESVRILENFQVVEQTPPTYGRDSNSILYELMNVPPRPRETADELDAIARLIDDADFKEARRRLDALAKQLGQNDEEIVRQRTALHFLTGG